MLRHILAHYAVFARRNPELGLGALASDLYHVLEVPHALNVSAIVPAEIIALPLLDHEDHGVDPLRVLQRVEAVLLRTLHVAEHISALERVAAGAHRARYLDQKCANRAVARWYSVGVAGHLGWFSELAGYGLGFERLIVYLCGLQNIRDAIPYPRVPGWAQF